MCVSDLLIGRLDIAMVKNRRWAMFAPFNSDYEFILCGFC